jgi:hypothetical protein
MQEKKYDIKKRGKEKKNFLKYRSDDGTHGTLNIFGEGLN